MRIAKSCCGQDTLRRLNSLALLAEWIVLYLMGFMWVRWLARSARPSEQCTSRLRASSSGNARRARKFNAAARKED
jgi:hypothetical protein